MKRFIVYVNATEVVTYKHVVEAETHEAARALAEELRDDEGEWVNTDTQDSTITKIEEVT